MTCIIATAMCSCHAIVRAQLVGGAGHGSHVRVCDMRVLLYSTRLAYSIAESFNIWLCLYP